MIEAATALGIEAKIVGRVEASDKKNWYSKPAEKKSYTRFKYRLAATYYLVNINQVVSNCQLLF
ncbi:hypothetical protein [Paraflavitalea speifideaquila]|uniref:hypothetical protein n=1 Tax=Paraflavitalea speifideaquila TaxID=3076558 RepID=UPI0028E6CA1C|nr:hypothetical protein [Paraflavitalea speifideiaquila]